MTNQTISKKFPNSKVNLVNCSTGCAVTDYTDGLEVILYIKQNARTPHCAEVIGDGDNEDHYAEIGLEFEGMELTGYDGVYALPSEVISMLRENGFIVGKDFEN